MNKLLSLLAAMLLFAAGATAQSKGSRYDQVVNLIKSKGYSLSVNQGDGYVDLKQGEVGFVWKEFYNGDNYMVVAFSDDDDVTDMDLFIEDEDGDVISKDDDASSVAVVTYTPSKDRKLKVRYKNTRSGTPAYESRCRLLIAYLEK